MTSQGQTLKNISQLALQCALENQIDEVCGSRIYGISEPWQQGELRKHPNVTIVADSQSLERAVASPEFEFIYVPVDAPITQAITRSILQRNPLNKNILWERKVGDESRVAHVQDEHD